jgi:hypothetical protein
MAPGAELKNHLHPFLELKYAIVALNEQPLDPENYMSK